MDKNLMAFFDEKRKGKDIDEYLITLLDQIKKYVVFTSHCAKYTNPKISTKINLWAEQKYDPDGYLRYGNNGKVRRDIIINASYLPCVGFLFTKFEDNRTVYCHLKEDTSEARESFSKFSISYEEIRKVILEIKWGEEPDSTDNLLKQVYFPISEKKYHLLSILYPSSDMFLLKHKYQEYYYGEHVKELREAKRKNLFLEDEIHNLFDIVEIGFGGTKPQNISYINNLEHGSAYMFYSCPPTALNKKVRKPKYDFFKECIYNKQYIYQFKELDKLFKIGYNNLNIRNYRDNIILNIFDELIYSINLLRNSEKAWSDEEKYQNLPKYQKQVLDSKYDEIREVNIECVNEFIAEISKWIILTYKKIINKNSVSVGDEEMKFINRFLLSYKEVLI